MAPSPFLTEFSAHLEAQAQESADSAAAKALWLAERELLRQIAAHWEAHGSKGGALPDVSGIDEHARLPALLGLALDYRQFVDTAPAAQSLRSYKKHFLGIFLRLLNSEHQRLHGIVGHRPGSAGALLNASLLDWQRIGKAISQELNELTQPSMGEVEQADDSSTYAREKPPQMCSKCKKMVEPLLDAGDFKIRHGYMFVCPSCGTQLGYGGRIRPLVDENGVRVASTRFNARRMGVDFCQFCGMPRQLAEAVGDGLQAHHIKPVCEGGIDEPSNIMILCPWCHIEAHRRRKFMQMEKTRLLSRLYAASQQGQ